MRVLVACEFSGTVREAFKKLGHEAWSCDLLPTEIPGNHHVGDALEFAKSKKFDLLIAHPPCTYLTNADANRWTAVKNGKKIKGYGGFRHVKRYQAADFFLSFLKLDIPRICIENPVGIMNRIYRKADQVIQPFYFGHPETKRTCFWLKRLPPLLPTKIVDCDYESKYREGKGRRVSMVDETFKLPPEQRWKARSKTYHGVANAMAEQWGSLETLR